MMVDRPMSVPGFINPLTINYHLIVVGENRTIIMILKNNSNNNNSNNSNNNNDNNNDNSNNDNNNKTYIYKSYNNGIIMGNLTNQGKTMPYSMVNKWLIHAYYVVDDD